MGLGIIGLGSIGAGMVQRLKKVGHQCVVYDVHSVSVQMVAKEDPAEATSIEEFINKLSKPRALWMMAPAEEIDAILFEVIPYLDREDVVIDAGSTYYRDDISRSVELKTKGVHFVEIGSSGDAWGKDRRKSMTIGGHSVHHHEPALPLLALPIDVEAHVPGRGGTAGTAGHGSLRCEPSAAGRTRKAAGTGCRHSMMVAYQAELNILHRANGGTQKRNDAAKTTVHRDPEPSEYHLSLDDIGESWRRGSVISSWLIDLAARALVDSPGPEMFAVRVSDSDEGRWTVIAVIDESIHAPVLTAALYERFDLHGKADFADTVLSALRFRFGGY